MSKPKDIKYHILFDDRKSVELDELQQSIAEVESAMGAAATDGTIGDFWLSVVEIGDPNHGLNPNGDKRQITVWGDDADHGTNLDIFAVLEASGVDPYGSSFKINPGLHFKGNEAANMARYFIDEYLELVIIPSLTATDASEMDTVELEVGVSLASVYTECNATGQECQYTRGILGRSCEQLYITSPNPDHRRTLAKLGELSYLSFNGEVTVYVCPADQNTAEQRQRILETVRSLDPSAILDDQLAKDLAMIEACLDGKQELPEELTEQQTRIIDRITEPGSSLTYRDAFLGLIDNRIQIVYQ